MKSINTKLLIILLFLSFIPLLLVSLIFLHEASRTLREDAHKTFENNLEKLVESIDQILEERIAKVRSLKESSSLASFIVLGMKKYEFDNDVLAMQKANGLKMDQALPDVGDLVNFGILLGPTGNQRIADFGMFPSEEFVGMDGQVRQHVYAGGSDDRIYQEEDRGELSRENEAWYTEALQKGMFVSTPQEVNIVLQKYNPSAMEHEHAEIQRELIVIAMAYESEKKLSGVFMMTTDPAFLGNEVNKWYSEKGYSYIVDNSGRVIARNTRASKHEMIDDYLREIIVQQEKGRLYHNHNLILHRRSRIVDWNIVTFIPESEILGLVKHFKTIVLSVMFGTIFFVGIAVAFLTRTISKPIEALTDGVGIITKGNLNHVVAVKSKDEIGELALAFNMMIGRLNRTLSKQKRAEMEIRQLNQELEQRVIERTVQLQEGNRELKKSYADLKKLQAQLVQSGKLASIGELAAGVAHELNQPLMIIRTTAQLLLRKQSKNALDTVYLLKKLNGIENNTKRMMNIINHLRIFSRQSDSRFRPVSVNNIIQDSFLMIGEQLSLKNIEVVQNLSGDHPKALGDTNQLEQVVLNLLANARDAIETKFKGQGDGAQLQKKIVISTYVSGEENEKVDILVEDNGGGIPKEIMKSIFDPFYTTKEVGKGTGLGLSISYGIIQDHKGEIDVAESGSEGTTFRIRLPRA